jgi:hypothetical protein
VTSIDEECPLDVLVGRFPELADELRARVTG